MTDSEILESNFIGMKIAKYFANQNDRQEIFERDGLSVVLSFTQIDFFNAIFLAYPVENRVDLEARIENAVAYSRQFDLPWILYICDNWLPEEIRPQVLEILSKYELVCEMMVTGMVADKLLPSEKQIFELEYFPADNLERMKAIGDICAVCFGTPRPDWSKFLENQELWGKDLFGSVRYVEGKAVAIAVTLAIADRFYLALVATLPEYRNRGYASTAIRHSMAQAEEVYGIRRQIVHGSPAGVFVYQKMGYRPVTSFYTCKPISDNL